MSWNVCQYHCLRSFHDFAQVGSRCQRFHFRTDPGPHNAVRNVYMPPSRMCG